MNYKRIGRALACLLLVCCLIVRISPIQAKAATLTGTVAAGTAIAAGLVALGIGVGATETTFNNLVDSLTAVAGSDRVPVWISETADGFVTYLQESFLGSLLSHCFDSGTLEVSTAGSFQHDIYVPDLNIDRTYVTSVPTSAVLFLSDTSTPSNYFGDLYLLSHENFRQTSPTNYYADFSSAKSLYYIRLNAGQISRTSTFSGVYVVYGKFADTSASDMFPSSVSTTEDLTLGSVGATMASPNYDPWRSDAIPVVPPVVGGGTADEEDALPVTFPGLDTPSITGQTQSGAQSGITSADIVNELLKGSAESDGETDAGAGTFEIIISEIKALPAAFASWLESILEWLAKIWEAICSVPGLIADAIANVLSLAFSVSDTFIATKVEALIAKYTYLEPMLTLGDQLKVYFAGLGTEPPIIYIDLGAATGSYYFGGRTVFVDLTWYEQYKPTMDAIIAGFLWLWVAWRFFQSVPGIIQGFTGIWGTPESVPDATFHNPKYQVGKNWLNSGSFYHRKGDRGE